MPASWYTLPCTSVSSSQSVQGPKAPTVGVEQRAEVVVDDPVVVAGPILLAVERVGAPGHQVVLDADVRDDAQRDLSGLMNAEVHSFA